MKSLIGLTILAVAVAASGQSIQLTGGDSSLFRAQGGEIKALFASSETAVSGGVIDGRASVGVAEKITLHGWDVKAGDVNIPFSLVTDFDPSAQFAAVGMVASRKTTNGDVTMFAGATATNYQVPFFFGSTAATPTAGLFYERTLTPRWRFLSSEIISTGKQSAIESVEFKPISPVTLAGSTGIGSNSPFASIRAAYDNTRLKGVVSYTKRAADFERIIIPYASVTENVGLDARLTFTSKHFNASADHENLLSDINNVVISSTVNSLSLAANAGHVSGNASEFYGESRGQIIEGLTTGIGATAGFFSGRIDSYSAQGRTSESITLAEKLSRRFSVNEFIQGMHSVSFGGEYHSNAMTMSGGYSMTFLPVVGTFVKVLSISLSIQLPHGLRIDGGTVTTPDGKTRWTAYGNTFTQGPLSDVQIGASHSMVGKYLYTGKFVTPDGEPVSGALKIGKQIVYADQRGKFCLPTNHRKALVAVVSPDDFVSPGHWVVISAPTDVTPDSPVIIVVKQS